MTLTDDGLVRQRSHLDGMQRVYRFGDFGISAVNAPMLHCMPFAWEFAVVVYGADPEAPDGFHLTYATPLADDVVVCDTEGEAAAWLENAISWLRSTTPEDAENARASVHQQRAKTKAVLDAFRRKDWS